MKITISPKWLNATGKQHLNNKHYELGWLAAVNGESRRWAVEHGGAEAGRGYDAYWAKVGEPS